MKLIKTLALFIIFASFAQACVINIYPDTTSGSIGDTIHVTVSLKKQHLNCPLPLDSTGIDITGAIIIDQTDWQKKSIVQYEKTVELILNGDSQATIQVSRICNIKPTQATVLILINNPAAINKKTIHIKNEPY
jgi:hypothetical protein